MTAKIEREDKDGNKFVFYNSQDYMGRFTLAIIPKDGEPHVVKLFAKDIHALASFMEIAAFESIANEIAR